jgi:outer membrane lipoprotein-sorting protein
MRVNLAFGLGVLLLFASPCFGRQVDSSSSGLTNAAAQTLHEFEGKYQSATRLQATFLERYRENGRLVRVESGDAYFLRPGKMRWDYQAPEKNTFVVDGKYVWFYAPGDHTATRMPVKQSEDWRTPLALLTSHMKLSRLCSKIAVAQAQKPEQPGDFLYSCTLRGGGGGEASSTKPALFELSSQGELSRIVIPQEGGIELEFSFAGWHWDPVLDKAIFQFAPPPNAVIVNGLLPEAPGLRQ